MKTKSILIVFLLLPIAIIAADRWFVRFATNRYPFPDGWPIEAAETTITNVVSGWDTNWSDAQVKARADSLRAQLTSNETAIVTARQLDQNNRIQLLADLFADFQTYENGWQAGTNYTAAQMQVILRKHNGALLLLKPMLKEIYDSRQ